MTVDHSPLSVAPAQPAYSVPDGLRVQCAWCDLLLREGGPQVSHGICPRCAESFEIGAAAGLTASAGAAAPVQQQVNA